MYSVGVVYNTFPTPPGFKSENASLSALEPLAQAVLDARAAHPDATLADLYDPDLITAESSKSTSRAGPRRPTVLYRRARFMSERERVEHLFACTSACRPAGRKGCWQGQAPGPNKTSASRSNARLTKATSSCPKMRTEPKARILEAFSRFAETSRRGTGSAAMAPPAWAEVIGE